ncbi:urea transporter 1 isoform X2 [Syngnathus scovelli]|uniref:urea transporter 1 isoform X2 n=1 Tax=Syngnathus scovelli TaxID=161590 RepID=UPI002110770D|nr:urea transporter 2 isoform X2 [Syngnathus scovelli]
MWTDAKADARDAGEKRASDIGRVRVVNRLMALTGDMLYLDKHIQDKWFVLQLAVWALRGVTRVILANNPLSGAVMLLALYWASPWQGLLGTLGLLTSTLVAVILGQDSVFFFSGLSPILDRWDLPVAVFPFNMVIVLYFLCTGPDNPYFPHRLAVPPNSVPHNVTALSAAQVLQGIPLGVGQIFACDSLGPSLLIVGGLCLYSPLLAVHSLLGSAVGTLAGLSMAVRHEFLYTGLSGFNGALGCMAVGGLFFTFSWKTHLLAIACAFLSAFVDIALSNLLGAMGLPACSWAATLCITLLLLLPGSFSAHRIPLAQVKAPERNLRSNAQWQAASTVERGSTDV